MYVLSITPLELFLKFLYTGASSGPLRHRQDLALELQGREPLLERIVVVALGSVMSRSLNAQK
jgi:hypothetical protein